MNVIWQISRLLFIFLFLTRKGIAPNWALQFQQKIISTTTKKYHNIFNFRAFNNKNAFVIVFFFDWKYEKSMILIAIWYHIGPFYRVIANTIVMFYLQCFTVQYFFRFKFFKFPRLIFFQEIDNKKKKKTRMNQCDILTEN